MADRYLPRALGSNTLINVLRQGPTATALRTGTGLRLEQGIDASAFQASLRTPPRAEEPCVDPITEEFDEREESQEEEVLEIHEEQIDPISDADTAASRILRIVSSSRTRVAPNQSFDASADPIMLGSNCMFYVFPEVENSLTDVEGALLYGQSISYKSPSVRRDMHVTFKNPFDQRYSSYRAKLSILADAQESISRDVLTLHDHKRTLEGLPSYMNGPHFGPNRDRVQVFGNGTGQAEFHVLKMNLSDESSMIISNPFTLASRENWKEYKRELLSRLFGNDSVSRIYSYTNTSFETPISHANRRFVEESNPKIAKYQAAYNFYNASYEPTISGPSRGIPHHLLPNIYMFATELFSAGSGAANHRTGDGDLLSEDQIPLGVKRFIRLGDFTTKARIPNIFRDIESGGDNPKKIGESSEGQYYQSWANTIMSLGSDEYSGLVESYNTYKNLIYVSSDKDKGMKTKINNISRFVPMYTEVRFDDKAKASSMASVMSNMTHENVAACDALFASDVVSALSRNSGRENFIESFSVEIEREEEKRSESKVQNIWRNYYDLERWFEHYSKYDGDGNDPYAQASTWADRDESYIVGESLAIRAVTRESVDGRAAASNFLHDGVLASEEAALNLKREHGLSYIDMCNGKRTHSEVLMYRIDKHVVMRTGESEPEPVQSFYITPGAEPDDGTGVSGVSGINREIRYLDSQVKFGERYIYKIFAHLLVVGMDYMYFDHTHMPEDLFTVHPGNRDEYILAVTYPTLNVYEVPYFNSHESIPEDRVLVTSIMDNPPPSPQVEVVPYVNIDNKIGIRLEGSIDDYVASPIMLRDGDEEAYQRISEFQRDFLDSIERNTITSPGTEAIRFRADDVVSGFEIFRTTTPPRSWQHFRGKLLTTVSTGGMSNSFFYSDDVTPNTDYYYTFRSTDIHGNTSNPSPIYKVRMVNDAGLIYPIIDTVALSDQVTEKEESYSSSMKKYLSIAPVAQQMVLDMQETQMLRTAQAEQGDGGEALNYVNVKENGQTTVILPADQKYRIGTTGPEGKKFKIRLTSKSSGKKLDLNVFLKIKQETEQQ